MHINSVCLWFITMFTREEWCDRRGINLLLTMLSLAIFSQCQIPHEKPYGTSGPQRILMLEAEKCFLPMQKAIRAIYHGIIQHVHNSNIKTSWQLQSAKSSSHQHANSQNSMQTFQKCCGNCSEKLNFTGIEADITDDSILP